MVFFNLINALQNNLMIYAVYALMMENKLLLIQYVGIRYVLNALIIYIKEIINYVVQFVDSAIGIIKYRSEERR